MVSALALGALPAHADAERWSVRESLSSAMGSCATVLDGAASLEAGTSAASRCAADHALNEMLGQGARLAGERGQARFGEHFQVVNRLNYSYSRGGFTGDLDMVMPLSFANASGAGSGAGAKTGAFFLQSGVTTWKDAHAFRRNDARYGLVRRFSLAEGPGADIVGVSVLFQQNLERGHERLVTGLDYAGKWGTATLNYFLPTSDWQPGRSGYEERPLEGMELGFRLGLTTTIDLETAVGRWEEDDGSGRWDTSGRLGIGWRPHAYLTLGAAWDGLGTAYDDEATVRIAFELPLGGKREKRPRWQGLGRLAGGAAPGASDMWRPIDNVGRVQYAERSVRPDPDDAEPVNDAQVRFLQTSVVNGGEFELEVTLPAPASEDTDLIVRLAPGSSDNPAVPGEDYPDEPIEVTIRQGEVSETVSVRLPFNPDLRAGRSVRATVFLAG